MSNNAGTIKRITGVATLIFLVACLLSSFEGTSTRACTPYTASSAYTGARCQVAHEIHIITVSLTSLISSIFWITGIAYLKRRANPLKCNVYPSTWELIELQAVYSASHKHFHLRCCLSWACLCTCKNISPFQNQENSFLLQTTNETRVWSPCWSCLWSNSWHSLVWGLGSPSRVRLSTNAEKKTSAVKTCHELIPTFRILSSSPISWKDTPQPSMLASTCSRRAWPHPIHV